jgi:hypothetical protein
MGAFLSAPNEDDDDVRSKTRALAVTKTPVLLDIVGAMGLTTLNRTTRDPLSPYCIVYVDGEEVSRTKAVRDDGDPIWTIQHNSPCVLSVSQNAKSQSYDLVEGEVTIKILHGSTCTGSRREECGSVRE